MTRLALVPLAGLLLAGCAVIPGGRSSQAPNAPDAAWLAGSWLAIVPGGDEYPLACQSDAPVNFGANGRYTTYGVHGRWRLEANRLTMTVAEQSDVHDDVRAGDRTEFAIERVSTDRMRQRSTDGTEVLYRRCPAAK